MQLSKNFSLKEMIKSDVATRFGIDNSPNEEQLENLKALCTNILQKIRDEFEIAVTVNSGLRVKKLNTKIGGDKKSQHMKGEAADIEMIHIPNYSLFVWIVKKSGLDFDQCIAEFTSKENPTDGWVHISYKRNGKNRNLATIAERIENKTVYRNLTQEEADRLV